LSRRVRELEATLGTRLLERGDRRLRLTEEGRYLLERAAPLLAELREVGEAVSGPRQPCERAAQDQRAVLVRPDALDGLRGRLHGALTPR
jgi:DNA-binding transcriptional LysR family regulator